MRTFIVFHEDYAENTRRLERQRFVTLQELLDHYKIDYNEAESEKEARDYIDSYNGDGDHYWMIGELFTNRMRMLIS